MARLSFTRAVVAAVAAVAGAALPAATASGAGLANRCFALRSAAGGAFVSAGATGLSRRPAQRAARRPLLPQAHRPGDLPAVRRRWAARRRFALQSTATGQSLAIAPGTRDLVVAAGPGRLFDVVAQRGCRPFPEAQVGATGTPGRGANRDGTVSGFVDAHLRLTADLRGGGHIIHGEAFDRFGIPAALGGDAADHGADGSRDVVGNLLRTGVPFGTHDVHGWPTFAGWPVHDTVTHQQAYYVWLQRAWLAGLRLVVAQTADDEPLCRVVTSGSPRACDETASIRRQVRRLRALQDYVHAQSGGRGRGWLRLVYGPRQARRVIERGKLAVLIGIESSDLFGCSERLGHAHCTRADVDGGVDAIRRLGVRTVFVAHWIDNAFAGAVLEGDARGTFINVFNRFQTGRYFATERCGARGIGEEVQTLSALELGVLAQLFPDTGPLAAEGMPTYPSGRRCNARGLTPLGEHLVRRLMARHMLIEIDHLSERARERVLALARRARYPLVSSHNGTGGAWTGRQLRRLFALGGFVAVNADTAPRLARRIVGLERFRRGGSAKIGLGTDTGGFSTLPGPRADAAGDPLRYPFTSRDGRVTFTRQRTGERVFDLNADGVAHYGLIADLIGELRQHGDRRALASLFGSAEAYLRMWQRAVGARPHH